ncbi:MAE_28990/MAE_18760 family HEPN-like nuclease [Comamonas aquatica]|uniref:MAE_28990/MAE_18760 family HEPN-like nuclease n=1 Tax=Comamonas aquatica TaxID=225991 RepID=UPI002449E685|nr:MAE_28990/MAE_18760 family HEPN-like nuclease [Comamonas aquatica]MDH0494072.1 MAE_28990/MAE_18760 family HEPN-like nuclease [Comamonas aquatica]MDH1674517.1 MAE_28990/MAE_18760 family HEPN-like nuclease [Comamonas aquatica]MDH1678910.1 MAE_28990/MAE_18760 family HEPN-like nuclease [Comamonas aquatica]
MISQEKYNAIEEISALRSECIDLINSAAAMNLNNSQNEFRIIIPFFYSIWERFFRTSNAIVIKIIRSKTYSSNDGLHKRLNAYQIACFLQKEPFYQTYLDKNKSFDSVKIKGGIFENLSNFIDKLLKWIHSPLPISVEPEKMVMTFSNVNKEVVLVNAKSTGMIKLPEFNDFINEIGPIEEFVGIRNDISHGALIEYISQRKFDYLLEFSKKIINGYCHICQLWIFYNDLYEGD